MWITFQDESGQSGKVTADLRLEYDGHWKDEIPEYLDELEQEFQADDETVDIEARLQELMIELPERTPVIRIERHE